MRTRYNSLLRTNKKRIVWSPKLLRPEESFWSIYNRFLFINQITVKELKQIIGLEQSDRLNVNLLVGVNMTIASSSAINEEKFNAFLNNILGIKTRASILFSKKLKPESHIINHQRNKLRYCAKCLANSYHTIYFQYKHISDCPIHKTQLLESCVHCGKEIPVTLSSYRLGYQCPSCGTSFSSRKILISIGNVYSENIIEIWKNRAMINNAVKNNALIVQSPRNKMSFNYFDILKEVKFDKSLIKYDGFQGNHCRIKRYALIPTSNKDNFVNFALKHYKRYRDLILNKFEINFKLRVSSIKLNKADGLFLHLLNDIKAFAEANNNLDYNVLHNFKDYYGWYSVGYDYPEIENCSNDVESFVRLLLLKDYLHLRFLEILILYVFYEEDYDLDYFERLYKVIGSSFFLSFNISKFGSKYCFVFNRTYLSLDHMKSDVKLRLDKVQNEQNKLMSYYNDR